MTAGGVACKSATGFVRKPTVRHTPEDIAGVRACLHGYPPYMKVEVRGDIPVVAKTVADLCSLSAWQSGLILNFPRPGDRYPESVVVVERGS